MDIYSIIMMILRLLPISIALISIVMLIVVHFGYKRMYFSLKKEYSELRTKYDEKLLEIAVLKDIYRGCQKAERNTGVQVDFDGNIEITRAAKDSKGACAQIDAIAQCYNDKMKD